MFLKFVDRILWISCIWLSSLYIVLEYIFISSIYCFFAWAPSQLCQVHSNVEFNVNMDGYCKIATRPSRLNQHYSIFTNIFVLIITFFFIFFICLEQFRQFCGPVEDDSRFLLILCLKSCGWYHKGKKICELINMRVCISERFNTLTYDLPSDIVICFTIF